MIKAQALLQRYFAIGQEAITRQRMLDFLAYHKADAFKRSLLIGHFTASAWLLNSKGDKVLLMHHKQHNCWLQLGGHCDGDEDLLKVALKEAYEESGMEKIKPIDNDIFDIDIHFVEATPKAPAHEHYDVRFLLQVKENEIFIPNEESYNMRWFGMNVGKLPTQDPSILRMFRKWTNQYGR